MKVVVTYKAVAFVASLLPMGGILSCALVSVLLHFPTTTSTACGAVNVLPSISASK